jgi:hypothetical protein
VLRSRIESRITNGIKDKSADGIHGGTERRYERYTQVVRKNKSGLDTISIKVDLINETTKIFYDEQEGIKRLVNSRRQT